MTRHVTDSLSAYLDEQVSAADRARIEAHLRACEECRAHYESLQRSVALVHGLDPVPAPEGFQASVRSRIGDVAPAASPVRLRLRLSWKTAGVVAAVVLIGTFSINLLREMKPAALLAPRDTRRSVEPAPGGGERGVTVPKGVAPGAPDVTGQAVSPPAIGGLGVGGLTLQRIIRTAYMSLAVDDVDAAARRLVVIAEGAGGFVASSSSVQTGDHPEGVFTLRVPSTRFGAVLEQVDDLGTVEVRRISGQDVTEEFVDLQARVRNLERHEQRLLSFMDRATKVSDLLAIEQELARVRGEIEMLTGRLRVLSNQVDLATVEVALRQKIATTGGFWDFSATLDRMRVAFLATIRQILAGLETLAVVASALVPVALLAGLGWLVVRRLRAPA